MYVNRKHMLTAVAAICLAALGTQEARADTIAQYTFPGDAFAPTTTAPNVSATPVNNTGSAAGLEPDLSAREAMFLRILVQSQTPAEAVVNSQFFQFTVTPGLGFALDLTSLTFDAARGGFPTPRGFVLRSSLDGFAADIATDTIPTQQPTFTPFTIDLTGAAFQNVNSALTLRIYGYTPSSPQGLFFDNITLNGQVIPEPGTCALVASGLLPLAGLVARRRKA